MRTAPAALWCSFLALLAPLAQARPQAPCPDWESGFILPDVLGRVRCSTLFDDGSGLALYIGGQFLSAGTVTVNRVARWDGNVWSALGSGIGSPAYAEVRGLAVFDDGSGPALFACGQFDSAGGVPALNIARWDGSSWSAVSGGLDLPAECITAGDDGSGPALYVAGSFLTAGSAVVSRIARWDGVNWSGLSGGLTAYATSIAIHDDGTGPDVYVGGIFQNAGGVGANHIARWDGLSWHPLGGGVGATPPYAMVSFDDGTGPALYVGGGFSAAGSSWVNGTAKWDGTTWSPMGNGLSIGPVGVRSMAVFDDGSGPALYAGGNFYTSGSQTVKHIARWDGTAWMPVGAGFPADQTGNQQVVNALCVFDDGHGADLYACGDFQHAGSVKAPNVARWDGLDWTPVGRATSVDGAVEALAVFDDGVGPELWIGGYFENAAGLPAFSLASWNGSTWRRHGTALAPAFLGDNPVVRALAVHDDGGGPALFAAGSFGGGSSGAAGIARRRNGAWVPIPGIASGQITSLAVFDDGGGPALYAAGDFNTIGATAAQNIAKWNGVFWSPLGAGVQNTSGAGYPEVNALAVFDDGTGAALYAAGFFNQAGGQPASSIARWNGIAWTTLGTGLQISNDTGVLGLAVHDDGTGPRLYASGFFTSAGGVPAQGFARWDGTQWSAVPGPSFVAGKLGVQDDGTGLGSLLFSGGDFALAGGGSTTGIGRWNGTSWFALGSGLSGGFASTRPRAYAWFDDGSGPALFVGGAFTTAGGLPAANLAKWRGCGETGELYCFGDGSGAACPCGNASAPGSQSGCLNSAGTAGHLQGSGLAGLATDTLSLAASGVPATASVLYVQGTTHASGGVTNGDGILCIGGSLRRLGVVSSSGGGSQYPNGGLAISQRALQLGDTLAPGSMRTFTAWYRDPAPFCTAATYDFTNALEIVWAP